MSKVLFRQILALFWSVVSVAYFTAVTFVGIPPDSIRIADTILGFILGAAMNTIIQYFFGDSENARDQDKQGYK